MTGVVAGSPSTIAEATVVIWSVVKPALCRGVGIDGENHGGPAGGVFDAIFDVHHRLFAADVDPAKRIGHAGRPSAQQIGIGRKKLHDDGLGSSGKVADHVLKHLSKVDVERGLLPW